MRVAALLSAALVAAAIAIPLSLADQKSKAGTSPATGPVTGSSPATGPAPAPPVRQAPNASLSVERATLGPRVPSGFLGLTMEYKTLETSVGTNPRTLDPAFLQLLRDIAPNQARVLRFGGDSTDWTWWPVPHTRRPPGIRYSLSPKWTTIARAFASALDARLILGVNLEADNRRDAAAEARALVDRLGRARVAGLEIGNEPELYGTFGWYKSAAGLQVPGRPRSYDVTDFISDFSRFARVMPGVPLVGPSSGAPKWLADLGAFLRDEPRVRLATVHAYPLKHCSASTHVTIGQLLSDTASHGLAEQIASYVAIAGAHHIPLRVDEMNGISCGGVRGVSDSFASALWALDTLFELQKIGVNGVNIQSVPRTNNEVLGPTLVKGKWHVRVHPEFYGLMMFAQAAPPGSQLLRLSGRLPSGLKIWATRAPDHHVRVVVINKRTAASQVVRLRIASAQGPAIDEQLRAPHVGSTHGATLGGQTFGYSTTTGVLGGASDDTAVAPTRGAYVIRVAPASATLLTVLSG